MAVGEFWVLNRQAQQYWRELESHDMTALVDVTAARQ
jgi:hypothetical protein